MAHENVELVVVNPMARIGHMDDFGGVEMLGPAILHRIARPTVLAINQQRRAGDAAPEIGVLLRRHAERAVGLHVVVELPGVAAVFVLVDAVFAIAFRDFGL